jgi:hypothetical protein
LASVLAIVGLPNDLGRTQLERWWWSCAFGEVYNNWQNKRTANDTIEIPRWLAGGAIPSNIDSVHSQPPSVYLARLVDEQGISRRRLDEILRSHYIEPKTLWSDDFEAFLDARMEDLSILIEEMMGIKVSRKNLVGMK